jgi:signal transduction histidine kinase
VATLPNVIVVRGSSLPAWAARLDGAVARVLSEDELRAPGDQHSLGQALEKADCALIDGTIAFARVARRIRDLHPALQVAVVVAPDQRDRARRSLLFAPGVGELWLVTPDETGAALVARLADLTQRRQLYVRTRQRIANAHAAAVTTPVPAAPPTERALASEAFLAGLLRVLPDPVFTIDAHGTVLSANDSGEQLLDSAEGATRPASIRQLFRFSSSMGTVTLDPAHETTVDADTRSRDGGERSWQLRLAPIRAGDLEAWAVVAHDLTEHYRAQRQLEEQAAELEGQAAELEAQAAEMELQQEELRERTAAAEHAQMIAERARAEANAANAAKSQFLATMSHELRTPLNAIVGYAELLNLELSGPLNDAQRNYLQRLKASGTHLLGLFSDILDLAKIDAGGMQIRAERGSVAQAIDSALIVVLAQATQRGVTLAAPRGEVDTPFVADNDRVRQILLNLLSNAVKFTEPGGRVTVSSGMVTSTPADARLMGDGPWARITITDTGIGIAAEMQGTVFDPFVQVDGGPTREAGGTGLGLAISRRLARLMGGDLTLESTLGSGSSFTLWLPSPAPMSDSGDAEHPVARAARARRGAAEHRPHGLRDIGMFLREELEATLESFIARIRADAEFVTVRRTSQPLLEDHALAFLADIAQSLVVADQAAGLDPLNVVDSASIMRVIAELHGRQRRRLGWTEGQLARGYTLLLDELTTRLERYEGAPSADATLALGMIRAMVAQARTISAAAYREAPAPA